MEVERFLRDEGSRRDFFKASGVAVAGGSAMFLAACGSDNSKGSGSASSDAKPGSTDVAILNQALALEQMAIAAYTAGAPLLKGQVLAFGRVFLKQEKEHAGALTQAIRQLGGRPVKPRSGYDFPSLKSQQDVLVFATDVENTAVAAYIDALPKLVDPKLRATAAAIVTNEAEHISILLGAQKKAPVPAAFVTGKA